MAAVRVKPTQAPKFYGFGRSRIDEGSGSNSNTTITTATVAPITGQFWTNGVLNSSAGLMLNVPAKKIHIGDSVTLPGNKEAREIQDFYAGSGNLVEVYFSGPALSPQLHGAPGTVSIASNIDLGQRPWYGPGYVGWTPYDQGFFDKIWHGAVDGLKTVGGAVVRAVGSAAHAVGDVVHFIAGLVPTPSDYTPENLAVVGWTDPLKFFALEAAADLVFPGGASVILTPFRPPAPTNLAGLGLGIANSYALGGWDRVTRVILDPIYENVQEQAGAVLDFAFNGEPALVRWALKKVAQRLPQGSVEQAIILVLSQSSDEIVAVIKDINKIKDGAFWEGLGKGLKDIGKAFPDPNVANILQTAGTAIGAGGAAIGVIADKGVGGIKEAFNALRLKLFNVPAEFDQLSAAAQAEWAALLLKVDESGHNTAAQLTALLTNVHDGVSDFAKAAHKLPGKLGDAVGGLIDMLGQLLDEANAFVQRLLHLAATPPPAAPAPSPAPIPVPVPISPLPTQGSMDISKLLFMAIGGAGGFFVGGPVGAAVGAAAGALLPSGKQIPTVVVPVNGQYWNNGVETNGSGIVLAITAMQIAKGDKVTFPNTKDSYNVVDVYGTANGMEVYLDGQQLDASTHGSPSPAIVTHKG